MDDVETRAASQEPESETRTKSPPAGERPEHQGTLGEWAYSDPGFTQYRDEVCGGRLTPPTDRKSQHRGHTVLLEPKRGSDAARGRATLGRVKPGKDLEDG